MSTIVVGVDGSPQALKAARTAADIAKALGTGLHIVTAVTKNEVHQVGISSDHAALSDVDLAEQDLHAIAAEFRGSIAVSTKAVRSNPAEALCSEAERLNASLMLSATNECRAWRASWDQWQAPSPKKHHATSTSSTPTTETQSGRSAA